MCLLSLSALEKCLIILSERNRPSFAVPTNRSPFTKADVCSHIKHEPAASHLAVAAASLLESEHPFIISSFQLPAGVQRRGKDCFKPNRTSVSTRKPRVYNPSFLDENTDAAFSLVALSSEPTRLRALGALVVFFSFGVPWPVR